MTFAIPTLREKAITVRLSRSLWTPNKFDKTATNAVSSSLGVSSKAGKFTKTLLRNCKEYKEVKHAFDDVYLYVRNHTLPWMDEGVRVLPSSMYFEFAAEVARLRNDALAKVKVLGQVWDAEVQRDQQFLGTLWNIADYPTREEMEESFRIRLVYQPIPTSQDFRIDIDEVDKQMLDDELKRVESEATTHVMEKIAEPLCAMMEKLAVPIGEKGSIFRDTLVSNMREACEVAKKLNINHDERIDKLVELLDSALENVTPEVLRESQQVRESTAKKLDGINSKLKEWF